MATIKERKGRRATTASHSSGACATSVRTRVRRQMRAMRVAIADGNADQVKALLPETLSVIDVGWRKGVLHRNTASRYKSRMAKQAQAVIDGREA
jgi:small subunit ribosomal protein S20